MKFVYSMEDVKRLEVSEDIKYSVFNIFENICENVAGKDKLDTFNMDKFGAIVVLDEVTELESILKDTVVGKYDNLEVYSVNKALLQNSEVYCITLTNKDYVVDCVFGENVFNQCSEENKGIISSNIKRIYTDKKSNISLCFSTTVDLTDKNVLSKEERQQQLIAKYEEKLRKVKLAHSDSWKGEGYIKFAEQELEAVKNGREW